MIILGIETATETVGVSLAEDGGPIAEFSLTGRRRHAETLAPGIAHLLEQSGWGWADIDAIAVDIGPGLFTGLRVGVAMAKGLALALRVGVMPITSLDVLARQAVETGWVGSVLAMIDLRRGEVCAAHYEVEPGTPTSKDGTRREPTIRRITTPTRHTPEALTALLAGDGHMSGPVLVLGDGVTRCGEVFDHFPHLRICPPSSGALSPGALVRLARERLRAGDQPVNANGVVPLYLRDADVRINWTTRRSPRES